jgi:hypothetical protein
VPLWMFVRWMEEDTCIRGGGYKSYEEEDTCSRGCAALYISALNCSDVRGWEEACKAACWLSWCSIVLNQVSLSLSLSLNWRALPLDVRALDGGGYMHSSMARSPFGLTLVPETRSFFAML